MNKLSFRKSFALLTTAIFLVGGFFVANKVIAAPPVRNASAVITPTTATFAQTQTYTYTVTNDAASTIDIGSVAIQLPIGFTDPSSINISSTSPGRTWILGSLAPYVNGFDPAAKKIGVNANCAPGGPPGSCTNKLLPGEFVTIQVTTTAPSVAGSHEWTAFPRANVNFGGALFALTNPQPTVVTVGKADQTITVGTNAPASAVYNSNFDVAATSSSSLPVAITVTGGCSGSGTDSATITMTSGTTSCVVHYNQAGDASYNPAPEVTETTTASKADAVIVVTPYSVSYDGNSHLATGTATGVLGEDLSAGLDLSLTSHTNAGAYVADAWTYAGDSNYNADAGTVDDNIDPADVTVNADALSKAFGDPDPALTYGVTGTLFGTDTFSGALSRDPGEDVGDYAINQGSLALSTNYNLIYIGNTFSISSKAVLTVTADDQSITYGDADPSFTFVYSGWKNSDDESVLDTLPTCSVSGIHSDAGSYGIVCSGGADDNYDFSYVSGTLTVSQKNITVTADPQTKVYGDPDPALTYTNDPLVGTDTLSGALSRALGENVGTYAINQGTVDNTNYLITFVGDNLTITKADQTINFGALSDKSVTDPDFAISATSTSGLLASFASTTPLVCSVSSSTVHLVAAGTCTITASQGGDSNYNATSDVSQSFTVSSTPVDTTPDAFHFVDQNGVALSTLIESNVITVSGINGSTAISISGGEYSKNGAAFTALPGTVDGGDTVKVHNTSSSSNSTAVNTTLTVGGVSDTFTSTTVAIAIIPTSSSSGGGGYKQCADRKDNDNDGLIDSADPGCHSDNDANNINSYVPADGDETNGQVLGIEKFIFTQLMKFGKKGGEVPELQKFLNAALFNSGLVDGKFGPITKAAVKAYQKANPPLKIDGIVGPLTRAVLNR